MTPRPGMLGTDAADLPGGHAGARAAYPARRRRRHARGESPDIAGTLVYGDTARAAFAADFALPGRGVDVAVGPPAGLWYDRSGPHDGSGSRDREALTEQTLTTLRALPGVAEADGRVVADLALLGPDGRALANDGRVGFAISLPHRDRMSPLRLVVGRLPAGAGEAALDRPPPSASASPACPPAAASPCSTRRGTRGR